MPEPISLSSSLILESEILETNEYPDNDESKIEISVSETKAQIKESVIAVSNEIEMPDDENDEYVLKDIETEEPKSSKPARRRAKVEENNEISEHEHQRRLQGPHPPIVKNIERYFFALFCFQILNLAFLWWGWRNEAAGSSFVILLLINFMSIIVQFCYFKFKVSSQLSTFYNLWWSKNDSVVRKMKGLVQRESEDIWQFGLLVIILLIQCGTLLCGLPAVALKGNWWQVVSSLDPAPQGLFYCLAIGLFINIIIVAYIIYLSIRNHLYSFHIIATNDFAFIDGNDAEEKV